MKGYEFRLLSTKNVNAGAAYFRGIFASRRGSVASYMTDEAWRKSPKRRRAKGNFNNIDVFPGGQYMPHRSISVDMVKTFRSLYRVRNTVA